MNTPMSSDQALADDLPVSHSIPGGALLIALIGWGVALVTVLALPWPLHGAQPAPNGSHLMRVLDSVPGEDAVSAVLRRLVDAAIYVILIVELGALVSAALRDSRAALRWLAVAAALGVAYTAGLALYTSPMLSMCGFVLTLCGAAVGLSAAAVSRPDKNKQEPLEKGHNDATYSPA